jgi:hypothetical protein
MERGTFLEGQKHGVWTGFFEDESIQWRGSYNEGKPEGLWEEYYHSPYHMKKMKNYLHLDLKILHENLLKKNILKKKMKVDIFLKKRIKTKYL